MILFAQRKVSMFNKCLITNIKNLDLAVNAIPEDASEILPSAKKPSKNLEPYLHLLPRILLKNPAHSMRIVTGKKQ